MVAWGIHGGLVVEWMTRGVRGPGFNTFPWSKMLKASFKVILAAMGEKQSMEFPIKSDTNWPLKFQKRARSLKFRI